MAIPAKLIEKLSSPQPSIRNAAAMELMDLGNAEAIPFLINAIEHPDNRNARGTLIYALSAFDCSKLFSHLFRWVSEGGFEAAGEALNIIHNQELSPSHLERPACEKIVAQLRGTSNLENTNLASELEALIHAQIR
jgi:hypothetical protein